MRHCALCEKDFATDSGHAQHMTKVHGSKARGAAAGAASRSVAIQFSVLILHASPSVYLLGALPFISLLTFQRFIIIFFSGMLALKPFRRRLNPKLFPL